MSHTLDLLTVEHGTIAGYRAGCRTNAACQSDPSCVAVHTRYAGDYSFSKRVDAGEAPAAIFAEEEAERAAVRARDRAANRAASKTADREQRHDEARKRRAKSPRRETIAQKHGAEIIRLSAEGLPDRVIAERLGIRLSTIGTARRRLGATKPRRVAMPHDAPRVVRWDRIRALHAEGKTDQEIADVLESSRASIAATRRRLGLPVNVHERAPRPARAPRPRIDHRPEVALLHAEGLADRAIAEKIGSSQSTVNRLRRELGLPANRGPAWRAAPETLQPHGTNACWARGCRRPECVDAHKAYHREYWRKRRTVDDSHDHHGTAYGYALGCRARSGCPSTPSCADASLAADRARRRAAGIPAKDLVDAAPVRAHVRDLNNAGMAYQQIAGAAGVPFASVKSLMFSRGKDRPRVESLLAERAAAILSIPIPNERTTS